METCSKPMIFSEKELKILKSGLNLILNNNTEENKNDIYLLLGKVYKELLDISSLAEKNDLNQDNKSYLYVKYEDEKEPKTFNGKSYSYFTNKDFDVGDIVIAPTKYGESIARVSQINVPIEEVREIIPSMKEITKKIDRDRFLNFYEIVEVAA